MSRSIFKVAIICIQVAVIGLSNSAFGADVVSFSGSGDDLTMEESQSEDVVNSYSVQAGDTLWDISNKFLGNSYYWPRLWSINDYITNPHWIYPGNLKVFKLGTLIEPPQIELETVDYRDGYTVEGLEFDDVEVSCGPDIRFDKHIGALSYMAPGFLAEKEDLEVFGTVHKARSGMTVLSERNIVYLDLDDPDAYECGDVVMLFRRMQKKVKHPDVRGLKFGSLYRVVATAKVVHKSGNYVSAVIRDSYSEAYRGDLVGPVMPVALEVEVGKPKGDLDAVLLTRLGQEMAMMSSRETIFLDRGRADGLRVGNSFYLIERRDENTDWWDEDPSLPASVVGRAVVVRVDEYSSTAVITDSDRNLAVGSHLTMKVE